MFEVNLILKIAKALRWLGAASFILMACSTARTEPERVRIETADEVELQGWYYPSSQKDKALCALLLQDLSGTVPNPGWESLAERLQAKGYAVLLFDFRGYGGSTEVQPAFWELSASQRLKGAKLKKSTISHKDFPQGYYPMLVNDIAAARHFLDRKNDARECNSGNMAIIAAQEGAALGALWLAAEWQRRPARKKGMVTDQSLAGHDIMAAVWLTMVPTLGGALAPKVSIADWIKPQRDRTPMAFFYGEEDKKAADLATTLCNKVLHANVPPRLKHTAVKGVRTRKAGAELLQGSLGTVEKIINYLDNVREARDEQLWVDRETKRGRLDLVPLKRFGFPLPP
jgi:hypothetical protein